VIKKIENLVGTSRVSIYIAGTASICVECRRLTGWACGRNDCYDSNRLLVNTEASSSAEIFL
jgi:hypothetical protein